MKDGNFKERLSAAKDAKQAMLSKFRQRPGVDDPAVAERRAARVAVSAAREARQAQREEIRVREETRLAAERERQAAAAEAMQAAEVQRAAAEKAANDANRELKLKAARDKRYAARKSR